MDKIILGRSGVSVSRLCFGGLTVGPLQANMTTDAGARVIARAIEQGVNFIDTAQLYGTYGHIRRAMELTGNDDLVIASKTYACERKAAIESVEQARRELDRDHIDLFLLHEQESELTLRGHRAALEYLFECKQKGMIRAVGVSMHHIAAVAAAAKMPEIDVIHPIINSKGLGIADGGLDEMLAAVKAAYNAGLGVYSMKPLGGGNLISDYEKSMKYVLGLDFVHSVAVGMQSAEEVDANIALFEGREIPRGSAEELKKQERKLHIENWCTGCGSCIAACGQKALAVADGKVYVNRGKCVLCGYCGARCGEFAIKVV